MGQYIDPFFAECRAFGRLQETGHEDLAIKCHGYIMLDKKYEEIIAPQLRKTHDILAYRSFYHEPTEPAPPIRCIVKDLGAPTRLNQKLVWKLFEDVKKLHQLGIFHLDLKMEQLIDGKIADFSIAKTMPHFITNTEVNPDLPAEWEQITRAETWQYCYADFEGLDNTVDEWNGWRYPKWRPLRRPQGPMGGRELGRYRMRRIKSTNFVYVNPYLRLWERRVASRSKRKSPGAKLDKVPLRRKPTKWFRNMEDEKAQNEMMGPGAGEMWWEYCDGLVRPRGDGYTFEKVDGRTQQVQRKPEPKQTAEERKVYSRAGEKYLLARREWLANGGGEERRRRIQWWKDFANGRK